MGPVELTASATRLAAGLAHLLLMDTKTLHHTAIEPILTLTKLAADLCVSAQTL
jgi:hypothetical protein